MNIVKWTNVLYQQTIDYLENGNIPNFRKDNFVLGFNNGWC